MRYALVAFLAVTMAGLTSQKGVGLPLSGGPAKLTASSAPRQVVFVNKAELAKLHPGWQALSHMRMSLARAGKTLGKDGRGSANSRSRTELAARALVNANRALAELQERKHEALRVRSEAMRAQKMQSAELDWKADVRAIEQGAAADAKTIDSANNSGLLNARLKAMAAKTASQAAGKDGSGIDRTMAEEKLKSSESYLSAVRAADDREKKTVSDSAARTINALKQASAKRVEEEIRAYEDEQRKQIARGIDLARHEMAQQMGYDATVIAQVRLDQENAASNDGSTSAAANTKELQAAVTALQARIENEVDLAVRELAASNGLAVIFQRRKGAPDATGRFAGYIKKRGWNAYGPVMGGAGSS